MFFLFNLPVYFALAFVSAFLGIASEDGSSVLTTIYSLGVLIPGIAVGVRRMHDTNHSGWWLLFPVVNLIFLVTEGTQGNNRFGQDPKSTAPFAA